MAIQKNEKEQRAAEAKKHAGAVKGLFENEIAKSTEGAVIHEDGDGRELELPEPRFEETRTVTIWKSLATALEHANGHVCVVDPAHFTRPCGNYFRGGRDPESQLCAESDLPPVLDALFNSFYKPNRHQGHGGLNSDRAVYIPDVVFTTGGVMKSRDVLVISPVNRKMALDNHRSEAECDLDMKNRIEALLRIAAHHGADVLYVNDFGCGYMGNDAEAVAGIFAGWLEEHPGIFEKVAFSIPGGPSLDAFEKFFPIEKRTISQDDLSPASSADDAEQDFDGSYTEVEQTSPGRWVFE